MFCSALLWFVCLCFTLLYFVLLCFVLLRFALLCFALLRFAVRLLSFALLGCALFFNLFVLRWFVLLVDLFCVAASFVFLISLL